MSLLRSHIRITFVLLAFVAIFGYTSTQSLEYWDNPKVVGEHTLQVADVKKFWKMFPYYKFLQTYRKLNICSLYRDQKLEVCNVLLTDKRYDYDMGLTVFPDLSCRPIIVDLEELEKKWHKTTKVHAFKCPTPKRDETLGFPDTAKKRQRIHINISYFVSSGNQLSLVLMYYNLFSVSTYPTIKPDIAVTKFPLSTLEQLKLKRQNEPYRYNPHFRKKRYDDYFVHRSMMFDPSPHVSHLPSLTESDVLDFIMSIKENKSPYDKFRLAFNALNPCSLRLDKKVIVCQQSFQNHSYGFRIVSDTQSLTPCRREKIYFEFIEEPSYSYTMMTILNCPLMADQTKNLYHVSTVGQNENVVTYLQVLPHKEILPDAMIKKINLKTNENESVFNSLDISGLEE